MGFLGKGDGEVVVVENFETKRFNSCGAGSVI